MKMELDDEVRELLTEARAQAPRPLDWHDVAARAPRGRAHRSPGRLLLASVAGLLFVLVAGLAFVATDNPSGPSDQAPLTVPTVDELSDLQAGQAAVPTIVPPGWTVEPFIVDGQGDSSWEFIDPVTERRGNVQVSGPRGSTASPASVTELAGVEWNLVESPGLTTYRAHLDQATVIVIATGFDFDEIEPLLAGLRSGPISAYPGGSFTPAVNQSIVASTENGTVSATRVNDRLCWAYFEADELRFHGCTLNPLDRPAPTQVEVAAGMSVLASFGTEAATEGRWLDTNIGVTDPSIGAVDLSYTDGTITTVQTQDNSGTLGIRFFIATHTTTRIIDDTLSLAKIEQAN